MTNQNTCGGKETLFIAILAILAVFQLGLAENRGIEQLRQTAEQGHAPAQYNLGHMYADGEGVPRDCREAVKWWS